MNDRNRPLYMISVAAELAGVHPQTLRNLAGVIRILDLESRLEDSEREVASLHNRVRRLADRVQELESREASVKTMISTCTEIQLRHRPKLS